MIWANDSVASIYKYGFTFICKHKIFNLKDQNCVDIVSTCQIIGGKTTKTATLGGGVKTPLKGVEGNLGLEFGTSYEGQLTTTTLVIRRMQICAYQDGNCSEWKLAPRSRWTGGAVKTKESRNPLLFEGLGEWDKSHNYTVSSGHWCDPNVWGVQFNKVKIELINSRDEIVRATDGYFDSEGKYHKPSEIDVTQYEPVK
ncbi:MAG: hypothetical protein MPJ24_09885 [Pirellulaceae bacterium]|nr:hypothetical protein [Pirellulaceae bacterium]